MVNSEKVEWVENLSESIRDYPDLIFTDYKGLSVDDMETLRKDLYDNDSSIKVVKNRLAKLAFDKAWAESSDADEDTNSEQTETDKNDDQSKNDYTLDDLSGVGPSKVDSLREKSLKTISDVAQSSPEDLTEISGVGKKTAEKIIESAKEMSPESDEATVSSSENGSAEFGTVGEDCHEAVEEWLQGTTAIAFNGSGYSRTAEILVDFAQEHDPLRIKGGILNGQVLDTDQVENLSELPSRRELLTSVVSALQKPLQKLVHNLNYPLQKLAMTLDEVKQEKED